MDRFETLLGFRRVVERGGFTGAAEGLGVSKAKLSKQVAALEARLGTRLLNRTTRRLSLTEAGRAFYTDAVRILDELDAAEAQVSAAQVELRGTLRVNAPLSFGVVRLMPVIARYKALHPAMRVDLVLDDRRVDLVGQGFDLTLRIRPTLDDSELAARLLESIPHVVCAAPVYVESAGAPTRPADLAAHAMLVYGSGRMARSYPFDSAQGATEVEVVPALRVNNSLAIREALLQGLGIAVTPRFVVADELAAGRLVPLLPGFVPATHQLFALFPPGRTMPAKTRRFLDLLVAESTAPTPDGVELPPKVPT